MKLTQSSAQITAGKIPFRFLDPVTAEGRDTVSQNQLCPDANMLLKSTAFGKCLHPDAHRHTRTEMDRSPKHNASNVPRDAWWNIKQYGRFMKMTRADNSIHSTLQQQSHTHTHTPVYRPFSGTTQVSRYQKGKTNLDFTEARVSGSGISWAICKPALRSRQITTPAPHHSVFLQTGCPSCRPTNSIKALKQHSM